MFFYLKMRKNAYNFPMAPKKSSLSKRIVGVDLFCGVGGLTHGLRAAGIDIRAGFDVDESCKFAYEKNNKAEFIQADVEKLAADTLLPYFADAKFRVLAGCAPCQPFSALRRSCKEGNDTGSRWGLLEHLARLAANPKISVVSMENVPDLRRQSVYREFIQALEKSGYRVGFEKVVNCAEYGVPQTRKRLVVLASRLGEIDFAPLSPQESRRTVQDAFAVLDGKSDPADIHLPLTGKNKERIRQSKPGGTWRDWNSDIVLPCHGERGHYFPASYGRMRWDAPAPTITTQFCNYGCGRFGHPRKHRTITVREAALLQTFPKDYAFFDKGDPAKAPSIRTLARHIGNAVPPALGRAIGESIVRHCKAA